MGGLSPKKGMACVGARRSARAAGHPVSNALVMILCATRCTLAAPHIALVDSE